MTQLCEIADANKNGVLEKEEFYMVTELGGVVYVICASDDVNVGVRVLRSVHAWNDDDGGFEWGRFHPVTIIIPFGVIRGIRMIIMIRIIVITM